MALLEFDAINKSYGDDSVLADLDFVVDDGEFSVIFGASGSGKSVILRMLVGLESPDSGTITIRGVDASTLKPGDRKIGYVPQSFALFPHKTVAENIAYPLMVARESKDTIAEAVTRVAALLDISELAERTPGQLSGGQKQRVAIARGLALSTELYVLDDPLVGLDFKLREKLVDDLRSTREALGVTFLYATSDASEALALGTSVAVLSGGAIAEHGAPYNIYGAPQHLSTMTNLCFPQSNHLPGTLHDGQFVTPWGAVSVNVEGELTGDLKLVAVVRPQHVDLVGGTAGSPLAGTATVMLSEDLGAEEVVYLESEGHQFTAVVRADSADLEALTLGRTIEFSIAAEGVVLFEDGHRVGQGTS